MSDARATPFDRVQLVAARALARLPPWLQQPLSGQPPIVIDRQALDPHVQLLLAIHRRRTPYGLSEPTPAEARARFRRDMLAAAARPPARVGAVRDFDIPGAEASPLRVRHYAPRAAGGRARALLVYLHGGGFVIGDLDTHDEACRLLCLHADTHVLGVDYRLAPEHPFPAALEDALAALRWAQAHAHSLGADGSRVALGGDSAGGNLTAVATQLAAREGSPPASQLLIYPATDAVTPRASRELFGAGFFLTRADCDAFFAHYTGATGVGKDDPLVSPLRAPDLTGLPPALVVTAGFDVLRDEGEEYAATLRAAGATVRTLRFPALAHGFVNLLGICPAARRATIEIARDWRTLVESAGARAS
jgi:acetyl esterase